MGSVIASPGFCLASPAWTEVVETPCCPARPMADFEPECVDAMKLLSPGVLSRCGARKNAPTLSTKTAARLAPQAAQPNEHPLRGLRWLEGLKAVAL